MSQETLSKVSAITLGFWIINICATILGETAGDLLSLTLKLGYAVSSLILISIFLVTLILQLAVKSHHRLFYWLIILSASTAGTTMSDYTHWTLNFEYKVSVLLLGAILFCILIAWQTTVGLLSSNHIGMCKVDNLYWISVFETLFFWIAILFANTLGTALGDFLAKSSGLGFDGGALLLSNILMFVALTYYFTQTSRALLFWIAFVLTRPFGAMVGDILTKSHEKGGLDFGTVDSSLVLFSVLMASIVCVSWPKDIDRVASR